MNSVEVSALHWATAQPTRLVWENGLIRTLEPGPREMPEKVWLAPPLFDLQVNGFGGVDFQRDDLSAADLSRAVHALRLTRRLHGQEKSCPLLLYSPRERPSRRIGFLLGHVKSQMHGWPVIIGTLPDSHISYS